MMNCGIKLVVIVFVIALTTLVSFVLSDSIITTIVGSGLTGDFADGGGALDATLKKPLSIWADTANNLYIADSQQYKIRFVSAETNLVSNFAGTGVYGNSFIAKAATAATIGLPYQIFGNVALDKLWIAEGGYCQIRIIKITTGMPSFNHIYWQFN